MARKRGLTESEKHENLCRIGDELREKLGTDHVKFSHVTFHNGRQWTVTTRWEYIWQDRWIEVPDSCFPMHSADGGKRS